MQSYSRSRAVATLFLLALIWGASFILMKKALYVLNPMQIGAFRMTIAALSLLPFAIPQFKNISRKQLINISLVGLLGNCFPAVLFPLAEQGINSAVAGVLNGLTPAFTLIVGVFFFGFRATPMKIGGLILGFIGAAVLAATGRGEISITASLGYAGLVVLATVFYGISSNLQRQLAGTPALAVSALALVAAALPHILWQAGNEIFTNDIAHTFTRPGAWTALGWVAILAVGSSGISFVIYTDLVQKTDAVFASTSTYITPIFALMWGLADGEIITKWQYIGMGIILVGVYLVNRQAKPKEDMPPAPQPEAVTQKL